MAASWVRLVLFGNIHTAVDFYNASGVYKHMITFVSSGHAFDRASAPAYLMVKIDVCMIEPISYHKPKDRFRSGLSEDHVIGRLFEIVVECRILYNLNCFKYIFK